MPTLLQPYLVAISVTNVDQATEWYQRILGFVFCKRMDFPEYALRIVLLEHNGFILELIEKQGSFPIKERMPEIDDDVFVRGFKKLAFLVQNVDELAATLKTVGVELLFDVSEQADWPGGKTKSFIIEDPDGNWVQFFQKFD